MGLLATLKVMLGVDSVEFQTKMRDSARQVDVFESEFGKRSSLVERHGMRLVSTAQSITSSMRFMSRDVGDSLSRLSESAGLTKLFLVVEAFRAGWNIGKKLSDITGLTEVVSRAGPPLAELAAELVKNGARFDETADAAAHMRDSLGLSGPQWEISTARTLENAEALLKMIDALRKEKEAQDARNPVVVRAAIVQKLAAEETARLKGIEDERTVALRRSIETQERFNLVHGQFVPAALQVQIALAAGIQKHREYEEAARRALNVWNAADVRVSAEEITKQVVAIAQSGGSAAQTVAALGGRIAEVVKVAKELGVSLDPQFERTAEAITQGPGLAMDDLFASFKGLPEAVEDSRSASAAALARMGHDLEGTISGGFGRGAEEGVNFASQQVEEWRRQLEATPIKLRFNTDSLKKFVLDVIDGRLTIDVGSAP